MTRTSNPCAVVLAFAAIAASGTAMAANTITFSGEVTDQTCQVAVNGFTDPTVILDSVPVSALDGAVGRSAGETAFTLQLTDCVAPTADEHFTTLFQATNPSAAGNLVNTAASGATGVALQLLDSVGGNPVDLAGGAAGYYMEKQKQISDDRARIGSYGTDVDRSTVEINRSVAYAKSAQSCYQSQFKALLDGRKNKSINEAEGRKRLAEIVSGLQETNALLVAANGRAGENISNYTQAYEKDLQQVGVPRAEVTKVAEAENRASTTKGGSKPKTGSNPKVPKEAVATEQTIRKAQDAQSEGNKVASQGQGMIREVCNSPDMGDWAPPSCAKA